MKLEVGRKRPDNFMPLSPEEFELFSHLELVSAIPQALFAVTTWKENGKPNICFHSWSCFHGDKTAFFAVMGGLYQHTHTFANIKRDKCFGINFLPVSFYDRLIETINNNGDDTDEFKAGGFTAEEAKTVNVPLIKEAFLSMECVLSDISDLSGAGITAMVTGEVQRITIDEEYTKGYEKRYGKDGFMLLAPGPQNVITGEPKKTVIANVNIERFD